MDKDLMVQAAKKLQHAKIEVITTSAFFGPLLYSMEYILKEDLNPPTAATDGQNVYFHPQFIMQLATKELVYVLGHEIMHCALLHITRRGNRDPLNWNIAADVVVNHHLDACKLGTRPAMAINDTNLYYAGGGSVDGVYALLPVRPKNPDGSPQHVPGEGGPESSMDNCMDSPNPSSVDEEAKWSVRLASAMQQAEQAGQLPGAFSTFLKELLQPKVSWKHVLRNFCITGGNNDRTWAKPNRRYMSSGITLPGITGERTGTIVNLVDSSGSVSDDWLSQFGAEMLSIQEETMPELMHAIYFDTRVTNHEEFDVDTPFFLEAKGRGGTCFAAAFAYVDEKGIEPDVCVMLTDGECSNYGPQPNYPVLWVSTQPFSPPWGQVVIIK